MPESYTHLSAFLLTLVDTFQQLGFNHDIHSTTNLNQALNKLPTPVRLDWNKYALEKFSLQPSLKDLSEWLSIYTKACRELPPPISVTRPAMEDQTLLINHGFRKLKVPCHHLREQQAMVNKVALFSTVTNKAPPKLLFAPLRRPVNISTKVLISRPSLLSIGENLSKTKNFATTPLAVIMFNIALQKMFVEQALVAENIILCSMRALETIIRK